MSCYDPFHVVKYFLGDGGSLESEICRARLAQAVNWDVPEFTVYLKLLSMTVALESLIYIPLLVWLGGLRWSRAFLVVIFLNLASHPAFVFGGLAIVKYFGIIKGIYIGVGESLVILLEALLIAWFVRSTNQGWLRALKFGGALASIANLFSWTLGLWLV